MGGTEDGDGGAAIGGERAKGGEVERRLRFRARLLDAVGQAVVATDLEGRIAYWNRAAEGLYGWPAGEAVGRPAHEVMVPEEQAGLAGEIWAELAAGRGWSGEFVVRRRDGTTFPAMVTDTPVFDERGNLVGIVGVSADVTERRRAEQKLRETNDLLRSVMEGTTDAVFVKDLQGRYLAINRAGAEALGRGPEQVIGKTDAELFPGEDGRELMERDEEIVASGEVRTTEDTKTTAEGLTRTFLATKGPYRDATGRVAGVFGVSRDITERKGAEEALRRSERRSRALAQNASDIVSVVGTDGTVGYVSPSIGRVLGHRPEERTGKSTFGLVHPDDVAGTRAAFDAIVRGGPGATALADFRMRHADGSTRHVEAVGTNLIDDPSVGGVVVNYRDVTERKRYEEVLRESEERFRALVQNASDIVTVLDAGGAIRYESPSIERVLGYRPEGLVGKSALDYVHPEDAGRVRERLGRREASGAGPGSPVEYRIRHADGSWRWVESVATNLLSDPAVGGVVVNTRDVTERKRLEERLAHLAYHDPLTGLPNRVLLRERFGRAASRADRNGKHLAVLYLDLDGFKAVNDYLGHEAGDRLLVAVAERLQSRSRFEDTVVRLGGDEFCVLAEGLDGAPEAARVSKRVRESLREPFFADGRRLQVDASIGAAARAPEEDLPLDRLLREADAAMYRAKKEKDGSS